MNSSSFSSKPVLAGDDPSPEESRPSETLDTVNSGVVSGQDKSEPSTSSSASNVAESELILQSSEALGKGISFMLSSLIEDFDCKAENAVKSQDQLCPAIDRLSRELDQLLENAPLPFIMQHATRISGVRKRVSSLNSLLKSIQRQIDNIDRILSASLSHGLKSHSADCNSGSNPKEVDWTTLGGFTSHHFIIAPMTIGRKINCRKCWATLIVTGKATTENAEQH